MVHLPACGKYLACWVKFSADDIFEIQCTYILIVFPRKGDNFPEMSKSIFRNGSGKISKIPLVCLLN